jgi:hypothetical protein
VVEITENKFLRRHLIFSITDGFDVSGFAQLHRKYRLVTASLLGSYKYLDMHMAIGSALTMWENKLREMPSEK